MGRNCFGAFTSWSELSLVSLVKSLVRSRSWRLLLMTFTMFQSSEAILAVVGICAPYIYLSIHPFIHLYCNE